MDIVVWAEETPDEVLSVALIDLSAGVPAKAPKSWDTKVRTPEALSVAVISLLPSFALKRSRLIPAVAILGDAPSFADRPATASAPSTVSSLSSAACASGDRLSMADSSAVPSALLIPRTSARASRVVR